MRFILSSFFLFFFSLSFSQEKAKAADTNDTAVLKTFISQLANESIALDIILSQYVIVEQPSDELYDYLEASLEEIRINLSSKSVEEINYIPYPQMPKKEVKDIDLDGLEPTNVFFLVYKERQMLAIYLENDKIGSFTLVAKGNGKAHFVLY